MLTRSPAWKSDRGESWLSRPNLDRLAPRQPQLGVQLPFPASLRFETKP